MSPRRRIAESFREPEVLPLQLVLHEKVFGGSRERAGLTVIG